MRGKPQPKCSLRVPASRCRLCSPPLWRWWGYGRSRRCYLGIQFLPAAVGGSAGLCARVVGNGLWEHLLFSGYRVVLSIIIAVILAAPVGMAVGQAPLIDRIASPLIYLIYPVPKIVLLPIIMLFLGIGEASKIFIISLILYFQILVLTRDAAYAVRPELILSVRSLGARRRHLLRHVYFPAVLPSILSALRITSGTAIAVLFFTETFATRSGLGYFIVVQSWGRVDYPAMYAGIVAMAALGLSLYAFIEFLDRRFCAWVQAGV